MCLVATLVVAQVGLARAAGPSVAGFITLFCAVPQVQCVQPSATALPAGGVAVRRQESGVRVRARRPATFTALQMNLCNSGIAGCFTGRAPAKAAQLILDRVPALVTVNEACESDVTGRLLPAMLALYPNEWLFWTFAPAADRGTVVPVWCTPDEQGRSRGRFGNGAVGRLFTETLPSFSFEGGLYPDDSQDRADAELRSWICADANHFYRACTTHLDDPSKTGAGTPENARVASNQCRFLTASLASGGPIVLLGDLNLGADPAAKYNVQGCTPRGWSRGSDGGVQHALAGNGFGAPAVAAVPMGGTTDHPALVVTFNEPPTRRNDGRGRFAAQEGRQVNNLGVQLYSVRSALARSATYLVQDGS